MELASIETYTLLLRELITKTSSIIVISGNDGIVDALSVAMYFGGRSQGAFPSGIFVVASTIDAIDKDIANLRVSCAIRSGSMLVIVSDANFPPEYTFSPRKFVSADPHLAIIVVARNPTWVKDQDFRIMLGDVALRVLSLDDRSGYGVGGSAERSILN